MKAKLTTLQYVLTIHGTQMGVGILILPHKLAEQSGTDGWISIILAWLVSTTMSLVIIRIMKKQPGGTIIDLISHYMGKWTGKLSTLIFALYFALLTHVIFIREVLFIRSWILPQAELYLLIALLGIPSYLVVKNHIGIVGRYSVLVYFMNLWTIIIFLMPLKYAEWLYLLPVMKDGWGPILADISTAFFPFLGFEIAFFLYPYLQNKEKASTGIITANTISLISYLLVTIEAFVFFSPEEIIIYHEPAIEMLKVIEFQFIERLEIVFFSFYLFIISTTVLPLMFMTVFCTSKLAGVRDKRMILATLLIMECLYVVFFPPSLPQNEFMNSIVENTGLIVACAFPLCLWAYVSIHSLVSGRKV